MVLELLQALEGNQKIRSSLDADCLDKQLGKWSKARVSELIPNWVAGEVDESAETPILQF